MATDLPPLRGGGRWALRAGLFDGDGGGPRQTLLFPAKRMVLDALGWVLPPQPPPTITAKEVFLPK